MTCFVRLPWMLRNQFRFFIFNLVLDQNLPFPKGRERQREERFIYIWYRTHTTCCNVIDHGNHRACKACTLEIAQERPAWAYTFDSPDAWKPTFTNFACTHFLRLLLSSFLADYVSRESTVVHYSSFFFLALLLLTHSFLLKLKIAESLWCGRKELWVVLKRNRLGSKGNFRVLSPPGLECRPG